MKRDDGDMITDMFGYIYRNFRKWSKRDKERVYYEAKKIVAMLEKELNIT